jgi:uridine kinase
MLTKFHSKKENVTLKDIYIDTELEKFDHSKTKDRAPIKSNKLIENLFKEEKIIIAGEDQSGKTTLCKMIFCELRKHNLIPVYISGKETLLPGKIENIIVKSLHEQYTHFNEKEMGTERIIPILDDFHHAKEKEKRIKKLIKYPLCIIVVDDIFCLNFKDEALIAYFTLFKIKELKPTLRYDLVKRWVSLTDKETESDYRDIDKYVDVIDATLGRNIGKGFMPAYPFLS